MLNAAANDIPTGEESGLALLLPVGVPFFIRYADTPSTPIGGTVGGDMVRFKEAQQRCHLLD